MIHMIFYAIVSVFIISLLFLLMAVFRKSLTGRAKHFVIASIILLPLIPYIFVEVQTFFYFNSMQQSILSALKTEYMSQRIQFLRILSIKGGRAEVYTVVPGDMGGNMGIIFVLKEDKNKWIYTGDNHCVWSNTGNADGNVFPPYLTK